MPDDSNNFFSDSGFDNSTLYKYTEIIKMQKEVFGMFAFNHVNFNVLDLERSLRFYRDALGLTPVRTKDASDGSFRLVFLGDGKTDFQMELTWLRDRTEPYDLGEGEFHVAFAVPDMDAAHERHAQMDCICFENESMGVYFIEDPDGYWLEIIPAK